MHTFSMYCNAIDMVVGIKVNKSIIRILMCYVYEHVLINIMLCIILIINIHK